MPTEPRLKGQEVRITLLNNGSRVDEVSGSIGMFDNETKFEIKEDGFLGEPTNRYDSVLNGYGGSFEFQVNRASWLRFLEKVENKATRTSADVFNVVRTDLFPNGDNATSTWKDVSFGPFAENVASRSDFVKVKTSFASSERAVQVNAF